MKTVIDGVVGEHSPRIIVHRWMMSLDGSLTGKLPPARTMGKYSITVGELKALLKKHADLDKDNPTELLRAAKALIGTKRDDEPLYISTSPRNFGEQIKGHTTFYTMAKQIKAATAVAVLLSFMACKAAIIAAANGAPLPTLSVAANYTVYDTKGHKHTYVNGVLDVDGVLALELS